MRPLGLTVGLRLSLAISSCRYAFGVAQSQSVITTLRSTPCGRDGFVAGSSPAAIRSVQSENNANARLGSTSLRLRLLTSLACPERTRRCHASSEDLNSPNSFGITRVALLPSW